MLEGASCNALERCQTTRGALTEDHRRNPLPESSGSSRRCSIVAWNIKIQTLSNQKVKFAGDVYVDGKIWGKDNGHGVAGGPLALGNGISGLKLGAEDVTCTAGLVGTLRYNSAGLQGCTKSHKNDNKSFSYVWTSVAGRSVAWSGGCKSHGVGSGWARYCSDGVDFNTATDYLSTPGNGLFTFKISGYYRVMAWADGYGSGYTRLALRKNGSDFAYTHEYDGHKGWQNRGLTQVWYFKEGDTFEAYSESDNSSYRWHSWNPAGQHSRLQLEYIGPLDQ